MTGARLALFGLSYRTAPVEVRERVSIPPDRLAEALAELAKNPSVIGATLLSTCNRTEVAAELRGDGQIRELVDAVAKFSGIDVPFLERYLYIHDGEAAARHVFRVASSLDSLVIGEPQIVGQVKTAYQAAGSAQTLSPGLHMLYQSALATSKKVRTESGIGEAAVSVPFAAVELAKTIFDDFHRCQILIIGSGKMGELAAKHLKNLGIDRILCANRTLERAADLAERMGGAAIRLDDIGSHLRDTDIVISSTGSSSIVLDRSAVERAMAGRKQRPMFLIDIAVPRDIDAAAGELANVYLYDIDDLQDVVAHNRKAREAKLERAETLLERELSRYLERQRAQDVVPTIQELRQTMESIRRGELEKAKARLGPLSADQEATLDAMTAAIVNKILHYPIAHLRKDAEHGSVRETIRKIFGLEA